MKKLYYGLLMIGTLVGMQSISYGAAALEKPRVIEKVTGNDPEKGPWTRYVICNKFKKDANNREPYLEEENIICERLKNQETHCVRFFYTKFPYIGPGIGGFTKPGKEKLDASMFDRLESEYNKQEQQGKAVSEQVPGGYMAPNPQGGWIQQKPESKDSKDNKGDK